MNDLIRRDEAIKEIKKLAEKYADKQTTDSSQFYVGEEDGCYSAIYILEEMKPVEPKTGHWIGTEYDGYADGHPVYDVYECSECGMEYDATDDGEITHNYCPNCGAKMERSNE